MNEDMILVIKWLESDEGQEWSRKFHRSDLSLNHMPPYLVTIKEDLPIANAIVHGIWVALCLANVAVTEVRVSRPKR
jgi:hypothetical protein